jgi:CubicO group peptidase (beta-lactamase class C family)
MHFLGRGQSQKISKLDSLFSSAANNKKPGGLICVLQGDDVIYKKAIGLANISKNIPNSFEFKYDLASIAKQFTAMCIALLEEQDQISVDDPLNKFYPEFQLPNEIKIKNLIDHTSGIREAYVLATLAGKANLKGELKKKFNTKEFLFQMLKHEKDLNFEPGTELAYTNINYILLADIVERISKRPFHQFADSAIFKPLKMKGTFYRHEIDMVIPGEATGYLATGKKFKPMKATGGILGDGKLVSTIDDLIKWEQNFRNNKLGSSGQKLVDKIYASSTFNKGTPTNYGYGLWNREYRGLKTISHGGDDGRFTSFILKFPQQGLAIICLSNSSLYNNTESTAYQIADILLEEKLASKSKPIEYKYISLPVEKMAPWVGLYKRIDERGLVQFRKISLTNNLSVSTYYFDNNGLPLKSVTDSLFVGTTRDGNQVSLTFHKGKEGISFDEQFKTNTPWRFEKFETLDISTRHFTGTYINKSTNARLKVKSKGKNLVAKKGIIKIPLIPFGGNQFYATKNDALFIFQHNSNGEITSLRVNASDFRNFVFEKVK